VTRVEQPRLEVADHLLDGGDSTPQPLEIHACNL
jgi:hypothetical protein